MKKIWSQYFLSKRLASKLLNANEEDIRDVYLLNLLNDFTEDELIEAYQTQLELIQKYERDFKYDCCTDDEDGEFNQEKFAEYICSKL